MDINQRHKCLTEPEALERLLQLRYAALSDLCMRELMQSGLAVDVSILPRTASGDYILPEFIAGKDYVDCFWQAWIGSIGQTLKPRYEKMPDGTYRIFPTGTLLASWTDKFFYDLDFECLFVRT